MILRQAIYTNINTGLTIAAEQNTKRLTYGNLTLIFSKKVGTSTDVFKINIPEFQLDEFKDFLKNIDDSHKSVLVDRRAMSKDGPFIQFDIHDLVKKKATKPLPVEMGIVGRDYEATVCMDGFDADETIVKLDEFIATRNEIMGED